jgi:cell division protein FtsL
MAKLNLVLALLLIVSGLYLVRISYESRRLFAEIDHEHASERQLESDRRRLEAERQAQATHLRVERAAREKLAMRAATPANTTYVVDPGLAAAPANAPAAGPAQPGEAR